MTNSALMEAPVIPDDHATQTLHVAIIMDGNGRWAKGRGLSRTTGHRKGAQVARQIVEEAARLGVTHLTLFGFSSENWKRPQEEVSDLLRLLRFYLSREVRTLRHINGRLRVIGRRDRFSHDVLKIIENAEAQTRTGTGLQLTLALNYGGRQEIIDAVRSVAGEIDKGLLSVDSIDEALFSDHLFTRDLPDPDLVIRTSGEQRLSNFLMWQITYAELLFCPVLWPDFTGQHLREAIHDYRTRERRFGGI